MIIVAYGYSAVLILFLDPILSLRVQELGVNENEVGIAFALMGLTYTLGAIIMGYIT